MIDKPRLEAKCSTWNITLTGTQLDQLDAFAQILVDYNQKVNLTAITDPEVPCQRHHHFGASAQQPDRHRYPGPSDPGKRLLCPC